MDGTQIEEAVSGLVSIKVLSMMPVRAGRLFALASAEIDIDGIQIAIHGIRAIKAADGTRIELPQFRDQSGALRPTITVPDEVRDAIGDAVLNELVAHGLARRRFAVPIAG
jgi:DNA-binding cell septation regulator SpoVG